MVVSYLVMIFLYLSLAGLALLYNGLASVQWLPPLPNLRWYVVHLAALGALVEISFAAIPALTAARLRRRMPAFDWATWLLLNTGLALLLPGIGWMSFLIITTGGLFVFLAGLRLLRQLNGFRREAQLPGTAEYAPAWQQKLKGGLKFYLAGVAFLLVGVLVGTGLWQNWAEPLHIAIPKEVHVHANLWGFTALVLAGMLLDLLPRLDLGHSASIRGETPIFWLMAAGALGLVLGPWLDIDLLQVAGLGLHTIGSLWLMWLIFGLVWKKWKIWPPGFWQLAAAYLWFFLAVVVAPLVVVRLGVGSEVAGNGGPILIFGWVMQVLAVFIPMILRWTVHPRVPLRIGGSWLGLAAFNLGSGLYWISLFSPLGRGWLRGAAYLLWLAAVLPTLLDMVRELKGIDKAAARLGSDLSEPDSRKTVSGNRL